MRFKEVITGSSEDMKFYFTGREALNALYSAVSSARESVLFEFFIIDNDDTGRRFKDLLVSKARSGLKVMVSYDAFGSIGTPRRFFREMEDAGIRVSCFNTLFSVSGLRHFNHRNHRKLVVVDGKVSFVGGVNVADRYFTGGKYALWRDTFCQIIGEQTAEQLSVIFYNDFNRIYKSGGMVGEDWLYDKILNARKSVKILTPYFAPSKELYKVMSAAAMRGVGIDLMMPLRTDSDILHYNNMASVSYALRIGMKVHLFYNGFNHSKLFLIDDSVAYVGSANMDNRSLRLDYELMAKVDNPDYVSLLLDRYTRDMKYCRNISTIKEWKYRRKRSKVYERLARLLYRFL